MTHPLNGMTQAKWNSLTSAEQDRIRDLSGLCPQLLGLEGWRVEVKTKHGETRRFIVSRSTGWCPCHIELRTRASSGGFPADREYASVRAIAKIR
jgi:hypothetical protein